MSAAAAPVPAVEMPASLDLEQIRAIPVQHDGRWPPLDTLARDIVETVTGDAHFGGHDPVLSLLAWTAQPDVWMSQPLISIHNAELRSELQLPGAQEVFSYRELRHHGPLRALIQELAGVPRGRKLDPLLAKVSDISGKLTQLEEVFGGQAIRLIPDPDSVVGAWLPIPAPGDRGRDTEDLLAAAWAQVEASFLADDGPAFSAACQTLAQRLADLPAARRPEPSMIAAELRYNRARPFRAAWMVMLVGAGLAAAAVLLRRRWSDSLAVAGMTAGFTVLTCGLSLRWHIAGRIPASNMFESLLFLSWGMGAFAILAMLFLRHRAVPLTASAMGALALILADCLPLDHYVRPIAPVLMDTVWMSIHVPIIMASYAVLALAVLVAHGQLVVMAAAPRRRELCTAIDAVHYWYILVGSILLLGGIITGSMWAASSWGRYWGWDPKEVWSLVAFLGYLAILHVPVDRKRVPGWAYAVAALLGVGVFVLVARELAPLTAGKLLALAAAASAVVLFVLARSQFATAVKSIIAFWLIVMTYVGVNYVLGIGLHSYGFGTGAVAKTMFLAGGIDLALVGLLAVAYFARGGPAGHPQPA